MVDEYQKHFGKKKEELGNISISLPHEISNQLILKTRENAKQVIKILVKNRIFRKGSVK